MGTVKGIRKLATYIRRSKALGKRGEEWLGRHEEFGGRLGVYHGERSLDNHPEDTWRIRTPGVTPDPLLYVHVRRMLTFH